MLPYPQITFPQICFTLCAKHCTKQKIKKVALSDVTVPFVNDFTWQIFLEDFKSLQRTNYFELLSDVLLRCPISPYLSNMRASFSTLPRLMYASRKFGSSATACQQHQQRSISVIILHKLSSHKCITPQFLSFRHQQDN